MQISFLKGRHSLIPIALVCVLIVAGSIVVGSQWVWIANASAPITECDRLAAHPLDKHAVSPGINTDNLDASKAVVACRVAVKEFPDERRFKYQLARALAKDRTTAKESFLFCSILIRRTIPRPPPLLATCMPMALAWRKIILRPSNGTARQPSRVMPARRPTLESCTRMAAA